MRAVVCVALLLGASGPVSAGSTDIAAPWAGGLIIPANAQASPDTPESPGVKIIPAPEPDKATDQTVVPRTVPSLKRRLVLTGFASYYDVGRLTANGERFAPLGLTAAHRTLPFGTKILVTNKKTGKSVLVRVNDRGPFVRGRAIDLSRGAARAIGLEHSGLASVTMEVQ